MFDSENFDNHERVVFHQDDEFGLRVIIAIHSTSLGPAAGGCRLWDYEDTATAMSDALRLSRGMSYKNALAGLKMGGGKSVILGPVRSEARQAVFRAFGRAVEALAGSYITAEDVGVQVADMQAAASASQFVSGLSAEGGAGGDPSPYTARGVRLGIEAAAKQAFGYTDLEGLSVAIQGLGGVGGNLAKELAALGVKLVVADINKEKVEAVCDMYGAHPADIDTILLQNVDILAPCALGGIITTAVASAMRARVIAGGANNQLASPAIGNILRKRKILYAPDYVINAGGIIMVAAEYFGQNAEDRVVASVDQIYERTLEIFDRSANQGKFPGDVADEMARAAIKAGRVQQDIGPQVSAMSA